MPRGFGEAETYDFGSDAPVRAQNFQVTTGCPLRMDTALSRLFRG